MVLLFWKWFLEIILRIFVQRGRSIFTAIPKGIKYHQVIYPGWNPVAKEIFKKANNPDRG